MPYVTGNTASGLVLSTEGLGATQWQKQHVCGITNESAGTLTAAVDSGVGLVDGCTCVRCLQSVGAEVSAWDIWGAAGVGGVECVTYTHLTLHAKR